MSLVPRHETLKQNNYENNLFNTLFFDGFSCWICSAFECNYKIKDMLRTKEQLGDLIIVNKLRHKGYSRKEISILLDIPEEEVNKIFEGIYQ